MTTPAISTSELVSNAFATVKQGISSIQATTATANSAVGNQPVSEIEDEVEISQTGEDLNDQLTTALQNALPTLLAKDNASAILGTLPSSNDGSAGSLLSLLG